MNFKGRGLSIYSRKFPQKVEVSNGDAWNKRSWEEWRADYNEYVKADV